MVPDIRKNLLCPYLLLHCPRAPQGLAIGNGFIDPLTLQRYSYFVREVGLVDDRTANFMKHLESTIMEFIKAGDMLKAYAVSFLRYLQQ